MTTNISSLPVAVIGAGPIGLAAGAHLAARGERFVILEAGSQVAAAVSNWRHVPMFSPWRSNIDPQARRLLADAGWSVPTEDALPTGGELIDHYLRPLAALSAIAPSLRLDTRVMSVFREDIDRTWIAGRPGRPFAIRVDSGETILARAVIDASGNWFQPNPMGAGGVPATGEQTLRDRIHYGIPDVLSAARDRYANRRVLVVGGGHSAIQNLLALTRLQEIAPETRVTWVARRRLDLRGDERDDGDVLPARAALRRHARAALEAGHISMLAPFHIHSVHETSSALRVTGRMDADEHTAEVDEIIVATGFRPDLDMLRELQLAYDPVLESSALLAPLIDPEQHSCATVPVQTARDLAHPEPGFFTVGVKSYGRAATFLLATGYEQIRSVVATLAGDREEGVAERQSTDADAGCADAACCTGAVPEVTLIGLEPFGGRSSPGG